MVQEHIGKSIKAAFTSKIDKSFHKFVSMLLHQSGFPALDALFLPLTITLKIHKLMAPLYSANNK